MLLTTWSSTEVSNDPIYMLSNINNVGKITGEINPILSRINLNQLPLKNILCKREIHHVRSSPKFINSSKLQTSNWSIVDIIIIMSNFLTIFFTTTNRLGGWLVWSGSKIFLVQIKSYSKIEEAQTINDRGLANLHALRSTTKLTMLQLT